MSYRFLPQAQRDLSDALDYYEMCQPGLGTEFLVEVRQPFRVLWNIPMGGHRFLTMLAAV